MDYPTDDIEAACDRIREFCGWHIAPSVTMDVEPFSYSGGSLVLPSLYVTAVNSVTVDGVPWPLTTAWSFTPARGLRLWQGGITDRSAVTVNITHGHDRCPASVRQAVAALASQGAVPKRRVKVDTRGPYSTTYADEDDDMALVTAYRIPVVA